jgi:hypothetical protein
LYGWNGGEWRGQDPFPSDHTFRRTISLLFVEVARLADLWLGLNGSAPEQTPDRLVPDGTLKLKGGMERCR